MLGEGAAGGGIGAGNEEALEISDQAKDFEVRAGLASGAEDAEDFHILASQEFGGDGGGAGGADFGQIVGGECEFWAGGLGIEQEIGGVDFLLGSGRDRDELYTQGGALAVITRHDEEGAVG